MNHKDDYIGVFDSGVGGISVLRHLVAQMPQERFLYFGDSANAPYGTRPTEEIRVLAENVARNLLSRNVKALVVACNTATAAAISHLRAAYPGTVIIGIEPALKPAALRFPGGTVGVMATNATLREEKFNRLLADYGKDTRVVLLPAPGIVELVEAGKADSPEMDALLEPLLGPWRGKLDGLVLGCTHFPFAAAAIRRVIGPDTVLFDGGEGTARNTCRRLALEGLLRESGQGEVIFENSAGDPMLLDLSRQLLEV